MRPLADGLLSLDAQLPRWEALAHDTQGESPDAAWERLAPARWHGDPQRCFYAPDDTRRVTPPSRALVIALCANPARTQRAELLAREAHARLLVFGAAPFVRLCWRAWPASFWAQGTLPSHPDDAATKAATVFLQSRAMPPAGIAARARALGRSAPSAALVAYYAEWWRATFAGDTRASESPFEPMLELFAQDTWLAQIEPDAVTLVLPVPELDEAP